MHTGPVLTVDLRALAANHRLLAARFTGGECAAVVKANAYGLGVHEASHALWDAGCRRFFVATLEEGLQLRGILPEAVITIFHGPYPGEETEYIAHRLLPVINSMEQWERWRNNDAPFALHVDTGMNRLGLTHAELESLHSALGPRSPALLMSHLACANDPRHPKNTEQLRRFQAARALLPQVPASLCNSSGIFLDASFHFDVARPGCSLYGINPTLVDNPMHPVVTLNAPIMQIRTIDRDDTVGYGAAFKLCKGARIAIVQLGYADGLFRKLSTRGKYTFRGKDRLVAGSGTCFIAGYKARILGRVSMDMVAVDLHEVPDQAITPDTRAEFINNDYTVDDVALDAGTIGYEVLTRLGTRIKRVYRHPAANA